MEDVKKLEEETTLLKYVSLMINAAGQVIAAGKNWYTAVQGVSSSYLEIRDWPLEKGAFFTNQADVILAPSTTVLYRMSDGRTVNMIMVSAGETGTVRKR